MSTCSLETNDNACLKFYIIFIYVNINRQRKRITSPLYPTNKMSLGVVKITRCRVCRIVATPKTNLAQISKIKYLEPYAICKIIILLYVAPDTCNICVVTVMRQNVIVCNSTTQVFWESETSFHNINLPHRWNRWNRGNIHRHAKPRSYTRKGGAGCQLQILRSQINPGHWRRKPIVSVRIVLIAPVTRTSFKSEMCCSCSVWIWKWHICLHKCLFLQKWIKAVRNKLLLGATRIQLKISKIVRDIYF